MKKLFSLKGCKIFPVGEQNYALKEGGLLMIYTSYSMTYILVGIEICIICMRFEKFVEFLINFSKHLCRFLFFHKLHHFQ